MFPQLRRILYHLPVLQFPWLGSRLNQRGASPPSSPPPKCCSKRLPSGTWLSRRLLLPRILRHGLPSLLTPTPPVEPLLAIFVLYLVLFGQGSTMMVGYPSKSIAKLLAPVQVLGILFHLLRSFSTPPNTIRCRGPRQPQLLHWTAFQPYLLVRIFDLFPSAPAIWQGNCPPRASFVPAVCLTCSVLLQFLFL